MRKFYSVLCVLLASAALCAGESIKFSDAAASKIYKPKGQAPFDSIATQTSTYKIVIAAPGVDPANFNGDSAVTIVLSEDSLSPDTLTFKFSADPKYVAGSKTVTYKKSQLPPGAPAIGAKFAVLEQCQIKFGKDSISISYTSKYYPFRAQSYINYGFLPNLVRFPEGDGTATKSAGINVTVGTVNRNFTGLSYVVNYKNKKVKNSTLWTGSAKGSISLTL